MDEQELFCQLGKIFEDAGHQLYLVGGSVRDRILDRESKDLDFTTDALPDQISDLLRPSKGGWADAIWDIGREFGTIALRKDGHDVEITTFRTDGPGRKPEVKFTDDLLEDLKRRDFTINAMAMPVDHWGLHEYGVDLVDPFGGRVDLVLQILDTPRTPEESFDDDPLRMMRAARFVSQLSFDIATRVSIAMRVMASRINDISKERIAAEMEKLLVGTLPERGIEALADAGILNEILPGVGSDHFIGFKQDVNIAWARLLSDQQPVRAMNLLKDLKMSSERMATVTTLVDLTRRWKNAGRSDVTLRHIIHNAGDLLELLLDHWNDEDTVEDAVLALLEREGAPRLPMNGKQIMEALGVKPGPVIGKAQQFLWNNVLCSGPMTEEQAIVKVREWADIS